MSTGGGGLGRGGILTSVNFSVQSYGLREVEEARTTMLEFAQDVDSPQDISHYPSSPLRSHRGQLRPPLHQPVRDQDLGVQDYEE